MKSYLSVVTNDLHGLQNILTTKFMQNSLCGAADSTMMSLSYEFSNGPSDGNTTMAK